MLTRNRGRPTAFVANLGLLKKSKKIIIKEPELIDGKIKRQIKISQKEIEESKSVGSVSSNWEIDFKIIDKKIIKENISTSEENIISRKRSIRRQALKQITAKKIRKRVFMMKNLSLHQHKNIVSPPKKEINNSELESSKGPQKRGRKSNAWHAQQEFMKQKLTQKQEVQNKNIEAQTELKKVENCCIEGTVVNHPNNSTIKIVGLEQKNEVKKAIPQLSLKPRIFFESTVMHRGSSKNALSSITPESPNRLDELLQNLSIVTNWSFRSIDDVFQELLEEVSKTGIVCFTKRQFMQAKQTMTELSQNEDNDLIFNFGDPALLTIFNKLGSLDNLNKELDAKDAFLASTGLARPGIKDCLRKRREEKAEQLNRSIIGRLRPNPRPRRFSDMITHSKSLDVSAKLSHFTRATVRARNGSNKTELTAAKKLAQAKSRTSYAAHVINPTTQSRRGRPKKTSYPIDNQSKSVTVKLERSNISTRPRRSVNVRHHLDWKFCYGNDEKNPQDLQFTKRQYNPVHPNNNDSEIGEDEESYSADGKHGYDDQSDSRLDNNNNNDESIEAAVEIQLENENIDTLHSPMPKTSVNKKRLHSILFKRKRPSGLQPTSNQENFNRSDHLSNVRRAYAINPSSDSSTSSQSLVVDYYNRSYNSIPFKPRHKRIKKRSRTHNQDDMNRIPSYAKHQSNRKMKSYSVNDGIAGTSSATETELGSRIRRISPSRRLLHHKHDQLRRLTLLDRVVLGLTCSVVTEGEQIHIKQLHVDDLNILAQRLNETGLYIKSLALKNNTNNDAEYNIVLAYAGQLENDKKCRKYNSPKDPNEARQIIYAVAHTRDSASSPIGSDYTDPLKTLSYKKYPTNDDIDSQHGAANAPCATVQSDDDEMLSVSSKRIAEKSASPQRPNSTNDVNHPITKTGIQRTKHTPKLLIPRRQRFRNVQRFHSLKYFSERSQVAYRSLGPKHEEFLERRKSGYHMHVSDESDEGQTRQSPSVEHSEQSTAHPVSLTLMFRRHSPRKLIRKVYTGTSTVPKILNRKRLIPTSGGTQNNHQPGSIASPAPTDIGGGGMIQQRTMPMSRPTGNLYNTEEVTSSSVSGFLTPIVSEAAMPTQQRTPYIIANMPQSQQHKLSAISSTTNLIDAKIVHRLYLKTDHTMSSSPDQVSCESVNIHSVTMTPKPFVSSSDSIASPAEIFTPAPSNQETVVSTTQATIVTTTDDIPTIESEQETEDGSYNPAMSMSASQLLRLKRMHDEPTTSRSGSDPQQQQFSRSQILTHQLTSSTISNQKHTQVTPCTTCVSFPSLTYSGNASILDRNEDAEDFEYRSITSSHNAPTSTKTSMSSSHRVLSQTLSSAITAPIMTPSLTPTTTKIFHNLKNNQPHTPRPLCQFPSYLRYVMPSKHLSIPQQSGDTAGNSAMHVANPSRISLSPLSSFKSHVDSTAHLSALPVLPQVIDASLTTAMLGSTGKRPIVHKYHSFRKISPKTLLQSQTTHTIASLTAISESKTTITNKASHAPQLLKSLLESGGHTISTPVNSISAVSSSPNFGLVGGGGNVMWNQPAHHSRGTWSVGCRAVGSRTIPGTPQHPTPRIGQKTPLKKTVATPTNSNLPTQVFVTVSEHLPS